MSIGVMRPLRTTLRAVGDRLFKKARSRLTARDYGKRSQLDKVVDAFQGGYRAACEARGTADLIDRLSRSDVQYQGFGYEGAAMAVMLLDLLSPWPRDRFARLLSAAERHSYLLHVGAGWALTHFGRVEGRRFQRLDPLLRWLVVDGAGFQDGFFRASATAAPLSRRAHLSEYGARVLDQGLGRSLWFTSEANPKTIAAAVRAEAPSRQPDLWSGVGLACAYAGGATNEEINELRIACGPLLPHMAQGAAFAAEAHIRAADSAPRHTGQTCQILCGLSPAQASRISRDAAVDLTEENGRPAYEAWRARVRSTVSSITIAREG